MVAKKILTCLTLIAIFSLILTPGCTQDVKETPKPKILGDEEKPKVVVEEKPKVVVEEKPKVVVEEKPKVVVEEKPKVVVEEKPKVVVEGPAIELALKYTPNDSATYRYTAEAQRGIKWEGPMSKESAFKGGKTSSRVEMTFTQQIQSADEKGNAVAKITIIGLKHLSIIRDNPAIDFDSTREKDKNNALMKLIGESYTIEITPAGRVTQVIDANQAQAAVKGATPATKTASAMLTTQAITERHTIPAMPGQDENKLRKGENWKSLKSFSFGLMGSKSYERIYTLKDLTETDNRRIALVEMKGDPTTETAQKLHKEKSIGDFSKMFENTETYTGRLELDLNAGKIEKCIEKLESEWIAVEPMVGEKDENKEPAVLTMTANRLYSLEKIE
ncbi:MAG: hypothetical protein ACYS67_08200 [Planctomycetota bacterium]|jgi:hypothetical protein